MHRSTILATQGLLLASQVLAAPHPSELERRQDNWDYIDDEDGNVRIRVSDNKINLGNVGVEEIVGSIKDECTDVSCGSGGNEWDMDTRRIDDNYLQWRYTISVHADGSFASDAPGTRNDLVDMAIRVLEEFEETEERAYTDSQACYTRGGRSHCRGEPPPCLI